jgi:malonate transporter and related proteins
MMILNNLFPVFALILFGVLLKRWRLTDDLFLKTADRLTYYIFFPLLLFWKIGGASTALSSNSGLYKAVLCAVIAVYILSTLFIILFKVPDFQAGTFSQSCYRFNSYIGVAIILNSLGEEGIKYFAILISIVIPIINVLCVSTLAWFSEKNILPAKRLVQTAKALISNPLILACIGGILYANLWQGFPPFIDNVLKLSSAVALPLALLSIGGALTLTTVRDHFKMSLISSAFKLIVLPVIGYIFLILFGVSGIVLKVGLIYFALPTSPSLHILSSQLNSDTDLASASIAMSTMLSFFSLSIVLLL